MKEIDKLARDYVKTLPAISYKSVYDFGNQNIKAFTEGYKLSNEKIKTLLEEISLINESVNFSSHNQMKEAITDTISIIHAFLIN